MGPQSRKEREVWQACDSLLDEGEFLSYQAIGERLIVLGYKRGSNSDIHRYLKTYKDNNNSSPSSPSDSSRQVVELKKRISTIQSQYSALEQAHKNALKLLNDSCQPTQVDMSALLGAIEQGFARLGATEENCHAVEVEQLSALEQKHSYEMAHKDAKHKSLVSQLKVDIANLEKQLVIERNKRAESERMRQLAYMRLKEMSLSVSPSLYSSEK